jgi:hypothetical protein
VAALAGEVGRGLAGIASVMRAGAVGYKELGQVVVIRRCG